ncbi:MAG: hypothetical protein IPL53_16935 [Ignavibacteria bacterium]|nr:hypothetical protein [Ignavibacteria bacterium]
MENKFYRILFFLSILLIIISFDLAHNPPGGWQKQMLPDSLSGLQIEGLTFVDSVTGFCIIRTPGYILKSTNAGFNWQINYSYSQPFYKLTFLNKDTGYVLSFNKILKTLNQGDTWTTIDLPLDLVPSDIYVYNTDTIWAADEEASVGGIFLTTNGGANWTRKYYAGGSPKSKQDLFCK